MKIFLCILLTTILVSIPGCGGSITSDPCTPVGLTVGPSAATVNHAAAAPNNAQIFVANPRFSGVCPSATAVLVNSNWTVSDTSVHLSVTQSGSTTATCTAAVASPVTVTATSADSNKFTGTAALTCN